MASDNSNNAPGLWLPDTSVPPEPVRQHFRYEHPALAALVEYGVLLAGVLAIALLVRRVYFYAHRNR